MCGIAGIAHAAAAPIDVEALHAMTDRLEHRGPDGRGVFVEPGIGFGHRRLSILDLSDAAAQPMRTANGRHVLTFNGQIYNFRALRDALERDGESFTSTGDTQVLLFALRRWGADALTRVQGMFAFAYWDAAARTILLARDRFGKKPLYFAPFGPDGREGFAFASELRSLLAHPRVRRDRAIDPAALGQYLLHEYVPAPRSILANVRKVLPGQYIEWRDGGPIRTGSYYAPRFGNRVRAPVKELADELTRRVSLATTDRLVADVPVGVFLSGGLDSSFVAACAVQSHPRVQTFSVGFEDPSFDESVHARAVARHLGTTHIEERLSATAMLDLVPSTLDWIDEPHADSSLLPTTLVAQLARRHVKVALGGDGGDETLAGYPTFIADKFGKLVPALRPSSEHAVQALAALAPVGEGNFSFGFKARQFAKGLGYIGARRHAAWLAALGPEDIDRVCTDAVRREASDHAFDAVDVASADTASRFDAATAFYLRCYLGEGVLTKVDRATMRVSLEARAPLLDTRVVEFCLSLDPSMRLRGTTTKWLMRQALAPLVPASILDRPKKGFGAPVGAWLRGPLLPLLRETLSAERVRASGWFDPAVVASWVDQHARRTHDHRKSLWALLVLEHWRQRWLA